MRTEFLVYQTKRLADQEAVSKAKIGTPIETSNVNLVSANWTTPANMPNGLNRMADKPCIRANGAVCTGRILGGSQGRLYQHVAASIGANSHFKANYDLSKIKIFGQTAFGASMIDIPGGRRLLGGTGTNGGAQCAGHREGGSVDGSMMTGGLGVLTGDTAVLTIPMAGGLECKACLNFKVVMGTEPALNAPPSGLVYGFSTTAKSMDNGPAHQEVQRSAPCVEAKVQADAAIRQATAKIRFDIADCIVKGKANEFVNNAWHPGATVIPAC